MLYSRYGLAQLTQAHPLGPGLGARSVLTQRSGQAARTIAVVEEGARGSSTEGKKRCIQAEKGNNCLAFLIS